MKARDLQIALLTKHDNRNPEQRRWIDDAAREKVERLKAEEAEAAAETETTTDGEAPADV